MLDAMNIKILRKLDQHQGGRSLRELAEMVHLSNVAIFKRVNYLEINGYIEQDRNPKTGRAYPRSIEITAKGSAALALANKMEAL